MSIQFGQQHSSSIMDVDAKSLVSTKSHIISKRIVRASASVREQARSSAFTYVCTCVYRWLFHLCIFTLSYSYSCSNTHNIAHRTSHITSIVWIMSHDMSRVLSIRIYTYGIAHRHIQLYDYCLFEQVKSLSPLCAYFIFGLFPSHSHSHFLHWIVFNFYFIFSLSFYFGK